MVVFSLLLFQETLHNSCREHKPLLRPIKVYRYVLVINCVYRSCAKRFMRQHTADLNTRKINFRGRFLPDSAAVSVCFSAAEKLPVL